MSSQDIELWMAEAFKESLHDFKTRVNHTGIDLSTHTSITDVYDETRRIQASQAQSKTLRACNRLSPYMKFLDQFKESIDVFAQAKPEILSLVWGTLRLILRFASNVTKAFETIVEALGQAGQVLPDLHVWASVFPTNPRVKQVLCLFYQDILDLHLTLLDFFRGKKLKRFFEAFWPKTTELLDQIQGRMREHKALLTEAVTLENIVQACSSRQRDIEESKRNREHEEIQIFRGLFSEFKLKLYDAELETLRRPFPATSGSWVLNHQYYKTWSESQGSRKQILWLQGIPGAGKTVLAAKIAEELRKKDRIVLFVFLTYQNPDQGTPLKVFQSLIFQLVFDQSSLQQVIREAYIRDHRKLVGSAEFVEELFTDLVADQEQIYLVVDGLDEVDEDSRLSLANSLLNSTSKCPGLKLLISCRNDPFLDKPLNKCHFLLRVDHHNREDISAYLTMEESLLIEQWTDLGADGTILAEAEKAKSFIEHHSEGMILYAKLMIEMLKSLDNPGAIRDELQRLPEGLEQAYERILERIKKSQISTRLAAEQVLRWLGCVAEPRRLRVNEVLQALLVEKNSRGFRTIRKALRDLQKTCGPIIDVEDGYVRFVHFSAKEYVCKKDSSMLNAIKSHQDITSTLLTYLSFDSFENLFSETWDKDEVNKKIKSDDLILFDYAATEWLTHLRRSCTAASKAFPQNLIDVLSKFADCRRNLSYPPRSDVVTHPRYYGLEAFPALQSLVTQAESYARRRHISNLEFRQDTESTQMESDPTLVSRAHERFRQCLESHLCHGASHKPGCECHKLEASYGSQLFKCDRFLCPHYSQGFATSSERDKHLQSHQQLSRLFANLDIQALRDSELHSGSQHKSQMDMLNSESVTASIADTPGRSLILIIEDAIQRNDLQLIREVLPSSRLTHEDKVTIFYYAAASGSVAALKVILENTAPSPNNFREATDSAIIENNLQAFQFCFEKVQDKGTRFRGRTLLGQAIRYGNAQIVQAFLQMGVTEAKLEAMLDYRRPSSFSGSKELGLFQLKGTQLEDYMVVVEQYAMPPFLRQYCFVCAVEMNTVELAMAFLQHGALVNKACNRGRAKGFRNMMPLDIAFKRGHTKMVMFLLENGAESLLEEEERMLDQLA